MFARPKMSGIEPIDYKRATLSQITRRMADRCAQLNDTDAMRACPVVRGCMAEIAQRTRIWDVNAEYMKLLEFCEGQTGKNERDAVFAQKGAVNVRALANTLDRIALACGEAAASAPAFRLIAHQVAFLCDVPGSEERLLEFARAEMALERAQLAREAVSEAAVAANAQPGP